MYLAFGLARAFRQATMSRVRSLTQRLPSEHWLLAAITLLAAFYRFYRLDQLPPGFHFDQAFYVFDALRLLQGPFSIFLLRPVGASRFTHISPLLGSRCSVRAVRSA